MSHLPLVSILLPVLNGAGTIALALRSVICQSLEDWELLLLDDGSTDQTLSIVEKCADPRIRVVTDGKNIGLPSRLNQGVALARGRFIARMDADDMCLPQRLQRQVEYLLANPTVDLVGTAALVFYGNGEVRGLFPPRTSHAEICRRPWAGFYLPHPTWMGHIEWFRKYPYRAEAVRAEDQDLLLRSYRDSTFACLPEVLLGYRQERPALKNLLTGRCSLVRSVLRQLRAEARYGVMPLVVVEQMLKGFADTLAVGCGLAPLLHRHRAIPLQDLDVARQWRQHWVRCCSAA